MWLRALREELEKGAQELLEKIGKNTPFVCESNSLRHVVIPGLFLMLKNPENQNMKQSAADVRHHADSVVYSDGQHFQFDFEQLSLKANTWRLDEAVRIHES